MTDLRQQQVDTERCVLVIERFFDFLNLLTQEGGSVTDTTQHSDAASIRDSCTGQGQFELALGAGMSSIHHFFADFESQRWAGAPSDPRSRSVSVHRRQFAKL